MSNLDDKLREILRSGALGNYIKDSDGNFIPLDWTSTPDSYYEEAIAQIKQAFADEESPYIREDIVREMIDEAVVEEWVQACRDNWQKSIPEQYALDRIKKMRKK